MISSDPVWKIPKLMLHFRLCHLHCYLCNDLPLLLPPSTFLQPHSMTYLQMDLGDVGVDPPYKDLALLVPGASSTSPSPQHLLHPAPCKELLQEHQTPESPLHLNTDPGPNPDLVTYSLILYPGSLILNPDLEPITVAGGFVWMTVAVGCSST